MADADKSRALDEAIAWHLRSADADEQAWAEFTLWLEADPANRLAFDRVEAMDAEIADFAQSDEPSLVAFQRLMPRRAAPWIALAGLAAAAVLTFVFLDRAPPPIEYATRAGETRSIALADGTRVELNTATRLLAFANRRVTLENGEAIFHVVKDASHPFVVTAGDRNIRDIGTVFDVLHNAHTLSVTVSEGSVGVSPMGAETLEVALQPGDRLFHSEITGTTRVEKVDPAEALSWRHGYLVYRNAKLSAVVSDLNRYFAVPVGLDQRAAEQRFTGVLRIDSQDAMLDRLSKFVGVTVDRGKDGKIILRASAARP